MNMVWNVLSGHLAYLSMLMVEVTHTHPVLRTFVELLNQTRINRLGHDNAGLIYTFFRKYLAIPFMFIMLILQYCYSILLLLNVVCVSN